MRPRNLLIGALFSIVLIAAVAWYGERTHWVRPHAPPPEKLVEITMRPLDPEPTEIPEANSEKSAKEEVTIPMQRDTPQPNPPEKAFTQPIEPPQPVNDIHDVSKIPNFNPGGGIAPFNPSQLDQQADVRVQTKPEYPYSMKQSGLSGEVLVAFIVDSNGDVRNAIAVRSTQVEFESSACKAVSNWKFKPGRKGGRAVAVHMEVPIVFSISNAD
jgi:periplasmic protein TonB